MEGLSPLPQALSNRNVDFLTSKIHPPPRVLIWLPTGCWASNGWWTVRAAAHRYFLVSGATGGWWRVFWLSCVVLLELGLASRGRGPSLFGDPSLMPQKPVEAVDADPVRRGDLKFWFGCGIVPWVCGQDMGASFSRCGRQWQAGGPSSYIWFVMTLFSFSVFNESSQHVHLSVRPACLNTVCIGLLAAAGRCKVVWLWLIFVWILYVLVACCSRQMHSCVPITDML
jgi:hypothetical protein